MGLTIKEATERCDALKEKTGKDWFLKSNKGSIKLMCGE